MKSEKMNLKDCIKPKMEDGNVIFVQATNEKGEPIYGKNTDGNLVAVLVPDYYVDANSLRGLFWSEYPQGREEAIRTTLDPVYDADKKTWICAPETIEVRLYANAADTKPIANGFGKSVPTEANKYPELPSAISLAFSNAMKNLGYIGEDEIKEMQSESALHYELKAGERPSAIVPIDLAALFEEDAAKDSAVSEVKAEDKEMTLAGSSIFAAMSAAAAIDEAPQTFVAAEITAESAEDVVFATTKETWSKYNGKTFRENKEDSLFSQLITAIARNPQRYEKFMSADSLKAAAILAR